MPKKETHATKQIPVQETQRDWFRFHAKAKKMFVWEFVDEVIEIYKAAKKRSVTK